MWLLVVVFLSAMRAESAFEIMPSGPRADGLGGGGIALSGDGWCTARNPALSDRKSKLAAAGWSRQFGIPELTRATAAVQTTWRRADFGFRAETFGGEAYRESTIGLSAATKFSRHVSGGAELAGHSLDIESFSGGRAAALSLGLTAAPSQKVQVGVAWKNVGRPRISDFRDRLPESLTVGVAAQAGERAVLIADIVQERYFPAELRIGGEVIVHPQLSIRAGGKTSPFRPAAGFSARLSGWVVHYAGDLHPDLGASHSVGIEFVLP